MQKLAFYGLASRFASLLRPAARAALQSLKKAPAFIKDRLSGAAMAGTAWGTVQTLPQIAHNLAEGKAQQKDIFSSVAGLLEGTPQAFAQGAAEGVLLGGAVGRQGVKFIAGRGPAEKLRLRDWLRAALAPKYPGLDRPLQWSNRSPFVRVVDRPFDRLRQGLAHGMRWSSHTAAVLAPATGATLAMFNAPKRAADTVWNQLPDVVRERIQKTIGYEGFLKHFADNGPELFAYFIKQRLLSTSDPASRSVSDIFFSTLIPNLRSDLSYLREMPGIGRLFSAFDLMRSTTPFGIMENRIIEKLKIGPEKYQEEVSKWVRPKLENLKEDFFRNPGKYLSSPEFRRYEKSVPAPLVRSLLSEDIERIRKEWLRQLQSGLLQIPVPSLGWLKPTLGIGAGLAVGHVTDRLLGEEQDWRRRHLRRWLLPLAGAGLGYLGQNAISDDAFQRSLGGWLGTISKPLANQMWNLAEARLLYDPRAAAWLIENGRMPLPIEVGSAASSTRAPVFWEEIVKAWMQQANDRSRALSDRLLHELTDKGSARFLSSYPGLGVLVQKAMSK